MKKITATIFFVLAVSMLTFSAPKPTNPILKFNADGKFRIVQFTDIHYQVDSYRSDSALVLIKRVILREKPDLVVLTGDVVCSKNTVKAWITFSKEMAALEVPWAVTLGNHDIEYELTGEQIMETIKDLPYCVTINGPKDVSGNGNYVLKISSSKSDKTEALVYCMDSHSSFKPKNNNFGLGTYHWFDLSQINWYREQSSDFTRENGGNPYPALAFFHIPLPEYKEVIGRKTTVGIQKETVCSPDLNSGMYTTMLECKDIMGMFTGHDHNNNYIGCLRNICLVYGNVSGRQCYGDIGRGARVIELYEGERKFDTWILKLYECDRDKDIWIPTNDYQKKFFVTYPDSFNEK